jgi:hypothetical protein
MTVEADKSPVLSEKRVRDANTNGGLNIAVWHTGVGANLSGVVPSADMRRHRKNMSKECKSIELGTPEA